MKNSFRRFGFGASIVTVIVCLVLITGSTFSLFTGGDNGDVIVNAANVEVSVEIGNLKLYSKNVEQPGMQFQNGGTADADKLDEGKLVLNNMSPMDRVTFTVDVTNKSTIDTVYRVKVLKGGELAEALVVQTAGASSNFGVTDWIHLTAATSETGDKFSAIVVSVEFPNGDANEWIPEGTGDNKYEGKSCQIDIVVEAVQANADVVNPVTYDAATNTYYINSEEGMMMLPEILANSANAETAAVESGVVAAAYTARSTKLNIVLNADMNMSGFIWTPVSLDNVNFNGNGKTISNLNCGTDDKGRSAFIGSAKDSTITGVNFKNVTASGAQTAAVVAVADTGVEISAVAVAGKVDLSYNNKANPEETSNAIGVIIAVGASNDNVTVSGNTVDKEAVTIDATGMKTDLPVDEMEEIVQDAIVNAGDAIFVEAGIEYIYEGDDKILYLVPAEFAKDTLTAEDLEGVTVIGNYSFAYNNNVKKVILPATVRTLGRGFDSSAVEEVVLNEGLEQIDSRAFRSTTALKEVVFSPTVKTICDDAFQKSGIKEITIPASVKTIGETAFGASLIEKVTFEGDIDIQGYAFRGCTKLRTVYLNGFDVNFVASTLNGRNSMWFCNGESNNPNTSNITFYVKTDVIKERVLTAMGAEKNNTPVNVKFATENGYSVDANGVAYVYTAEALKAALADKKNVVLACDITVAAGSGGYGPVGITVDCQTLDGNGNTLTVTGANSTWACAIYVKGGAINNIVVAGAMRGIFTGGTNADIFLNNVSFKNVVYTYNSDGGNKQYGVYATGCTFNGWTSFSNVHKEVVFTDCTFTEGSGYAFCRPYNATKFVGCTFTEGYQLDTSYSSSIVLNECTYGDTAITASNALSLTANNKAFVSSLNNTTIDGMKYVVATKLSDVMAAAKSGNVVIDAQGANLGDFNYDGTFGNGTVLKNAKFTYVYGASVDGVATFENCEFVSDHSYSANFSDGSYKGKVIFNNCYFDGWSSFGEAITGVEMNNCTFKKTYNYGMVRFYQNAVLTNCVIDSSFEGIDSNKTGTVVELNNCTGIEGKIYNNGSVVGIWIVDGVQLTDVPSW